MEVFYDRLFKKFLFRPNPGSSSPAFKRAVKDAAGKPARWKEVDVVANGVKYRTLTNANGEYRLFGAVKGLAL